MGSDTENQGDWCKDEIDTRELIEWYSGHVGKKGMR